MLLERSPPSIHPGCVLYGISGYVSSVFGDVEGGGGHTSRAHPATRQVFNPPHVYVAPQIVPSLFVQIKSLDLLRNTWAGATGEETKAQLVTHLSGAKSGQLPPAGTEKGWQGRWGGDASAGRHRDLVLGGREEGCPHLTQMPGFGDAWWQWSEHAGVWTDGEDLDCAV